MCGSGVRERERERERESEPDNMQTENYQQLN